MKFFQRLREFFRPQRTSEEVRYGFAVVVVVRTPTPIPLSMAKECLERLKTQLSDINLVTSDSRVTRPMTVLVGTHYYTLPKVDTSKFTVEVSPDKLAHLVKCAKEALDMPPV